MFLLATDRYSSLHCCCQQHCCQSLSPWQSVLLAQEGEKQKKINRKVKTLTHQSTYGTCFC